MLIIDAHVPLKKAYLRPRGKLEVQPLRTSRPGYCGDLPATLGLADEVHRFERGGGEGLNPN